MNYVLFSWLVITNIITMILFIGMLSVTSTSFETIVIASIAFIYTTFVHASVIEGRSSILDLITIMKHFVFLGRLHEKANLNGSDGRSKSEWIDELEQELKDGWKAFLSNTYTYYASVFFLFLFRMIAIVAILVALSGNTMEPLAKFRHWLAINITEIGGWIINDGIHLIGLAVFVILCYGIAIVIGKGIQSLHDRYSNTMEFFYKWTGYLYLALLVIIIMGLIANAFDANIPSSILWLLVLAFIFVFGLLSFFEKPK